MKNNIDAWFNSLPDGNPSKQLTPNVDAWFNSLPDNQNVSEQEYSWGDRGLQVARGAAKTYGGIADLASEYRQGHPTMMGDLATNFEPVEKVPEGAEIPKVTPILTEKLNEVAGRDLTPTDSTGKFLETLGEVGAPLAVPGGGIVNSMKWAVPIAGMAQVIKESGAVDDATADLIAAIITPNIGKIFKGAGNAAASAAAKGLSILTDADVNTLKHAEKHGVDMPFNVGLGSRTQNWVANNILNKSIFSSKKYGQKVDKAGESLKNAFEKTMEGVSKDKLGPDEASTAFQEWLKAEKNAVTQASSKKYEEAYKLANKTDAVQPKKTAEFINSDNIQNFLIGDISAAGSDRVAKTIQELADAWGLNKTNNPAIRIGGDDINVRNESVQNLLNQFKQELPNIQVQRLVNVKKKINEILDNPEEVQGVKKLLSGLKGAVVEDLLSSKNKSFVGKLREADKFFQREVKKRVRLDIANAITTGQNPKLAIDYMSTPQNIRNIKRIAGNTEEGKKVFDALREAKIRDILKGGFDNNSNISYGTFSKNFKDADAKKQETLKALFGSDELYGQMKEIAEISQAFSDAGKSMLNNSGTAITASDIQKLSEIGGLLKIIVDPSSTPALGAAGYAATVNLGSRLLSNDKFVKQLRVYAIARKNGKEKDAATVLNRLHKMYKNAENGLKETGEYITQHPEKILPALKVMDAEKE